jgi:hypothetical protein
MKNKVSLGGCIGVLLVISLVTGCASTSGGSKLYSDFMLPSIPNEEHAVLIVDSYIDITQVNDQYLFTLSGSSKRQIIPFPAGKYDLQVYYDRTEDRGMYATGTEIGRRSSHTYSENLTLVSHEFTAGHYYLLTADLNGDTIAFTISEETSPSTIEDASAQIGKVKVKEPTPWSVGYVKREPTKFEGTWESNDGSYSMSFAGNTIVWNQKAGILRGNVGFADDELTVYINASYNGNQWIASPIKQSYKFKYTLDSDVLTLLDRGSSLSLRKKSN